MRKKNVCLISGGGAWGAYGGGTLARINKKYNTVIGVSTGSLLAPLTALREWETLKVHYTNVNYNSIFDNHWYKGKPLNKQGKIKIFPILMTLLLGQKTIYTSNILRKTIATSFTETHFNELRKKNQEIFVGTQNFAQLPSKTHYFSSLNENYEDFIDWMWCSVCFPFFTSLVKKSWRDKQGNFHIGQWCDSGINNLVGIDELMGKGYSDIDIILHKTRVTDKFEGEKVHNIIKNITTNIIAMRHSIEFEYFYEKIKRLNKQGALITIYWLPYKLSANSMIFNEKQMYDWWDEGYKTAFDSNRIEIFKPIKRQF